MTTLWNQAGIDLTNGGDPLTVDLVLDRGGLRWEVDKRQAYYRDNSGQMIAVPSQYAPVRSDTGQAFAATVGPQWQPYQNRQLVEFALGLQCVTGDVVPVRAGTLGADRSRVFVELRVGRELMVRRGGERGAIQPFALLYMAHDGTAAIRCTETMRVLVCSNGAVRDREANGFSVRHTASAEERMAEGARLLRHFSAAALEFEHTARDLAAAPMDRQSFVGFAARLLTGKDDEQEALETVGRSEGRTKQTLERKGQELLGLFEHGIGNLGRDRFDALNAVTEFVDHQRGRVQSWRERASRLQLDKAIDSMTFGTGAQLKRRALRLLTS